MFEGTRSVHLVGSNMVFKNKERKDFVCNIQSRHRSGFWSKVYLDEHVHLCLLLPPCHDLASLHAVYDRNELSLYRSLWAPRGVGCAALVNPLPAPVGVIRQWNKSWSGQPPLVGGLALDTPFDLAGLP